MKHYVFGDFRLDEKNYALHRNGDTVRLTPTLFKLLIILLDSDGEVLTKEMLLRRVWPDRNVEEGNLNRQISSLRKILRDSPQHQRCIQTLPRIGYRFGISVATVNQNQASDSPGRLQSRENYTHQEKIAILRRHLIDKESVFDISEKLSLPQAVLYRWLKEFFEKGVGAFERDSNGGKPA